MYLPVCYLILQSHLRCRVQHLDLVLVHSGYSLDDSYSGHYYPKEEQVENYSHSNYLHLKKIYHFVGVGHLQNFVREVPTREREREKHQITL